MKICYLLSEEEVKKCYSDEEAVKILTELRNKIGRSYTGHVDPKLLTDRQGVYSDAAIRDAVGKQFRLVLNDVYAFLIDIEDQNRELSNSEFGILNLILLVVEDMS